MTILNFKSLPVVSSVYRKVKLVPNTVRALQFVRAIVTVQLLRTIAVHALNTPVSAPTFKYATMKSTIFE